MQKVLRYPYKHRAGGPPEGLHRPATSWRLANPQPLDGTEMGCKVGLQRASSGWPPLSILFYPLTLLCASLLFTSLLLASNSLPDASTLPTPAAKSRISA